MMTIAAPGSALLEDRKSKFHAGVYPVASAAEVKAVLADRQARHPKARHICYAYRLWEDGRIVERAYDAGEPHFTAGRPILQALRRAEVVNAMAVVVRYFGGVLLGKGGLIRAYGDAARMALEDAERVPFVPQVRLQVRVPFSHLSEMERFLRQSRGRVMRRDFDQSVCIFEVEMAKEQQQRLYDFLRRYGLNDAIVLPMGDSPRD